MEPTTVLVYVKQDCGLCEDMLAGLSQFVAQYALSPDSVQRPIELELRDIEDREDWYRQYREYVPTIVVNNQEVCHYFLDTSELVEAIECPSHK